MLSNIFKRKNKKTCNFGEHFTLDGYGGNFKKLNEKKLVLKCLEELPGKVGMNILGKPQAYKAADNGINDSGGWSGFVVIAESFTNAFAWCRSASESSAANATADPNIAPIARNPTANRLFMIFP